MTTTRYLAAALLLFVVVCGMPAMSSDAATIAIDAEPLTDAEMESVTGELHIFGIRISLRQSRLSRKQTNRYPDDVHCDILAQNKADDLGLDTRNQDGSSTDYNGATVAQIYQQFPDNRYSVPQAGTSGYYFSTSDAETGTKQHMGSYTRPPDSSTYTRYWNNSYVQAVPRNSTLDYSPSGVESQVFVPLPTRTHTDLYYR